MICEGLRATGLAVAPSIVFRCPDRSLPLRRLPHLYGSFTLQTARKIVPQTADKSPTTEDGDWPSESDFPDY